MFSFTLHQPTFTLATARKSAVCAKYWAETSTNKSLGLNSIEQDPMQPASFYKDSSN